MDVKSLCLGALTFGEASGYDIKKFFECTFSHFFVAGYGSIYPALAALEEQGLVTCRAEPQQGKPDRKVYALTEAGREAFLEDIKSTPPNHKIRSEFLVLMFFAHLLPRDKLRSLFDERLRDIERDLQHIEQFESRDTGDNTLPQGALFCAGYGKTVLTAARDYLLEHRDELIDGDAAETTPQALRTLT